MFSDPSFYALILVCFYGLVIYPGCVFDTSGISGGAGYSIIPPPDGCVNQYYYYDLNSYYSTYGFSPFPQYQLTSGSFPPGLNLDANSGILSGFPTVTGAFTFEVEAVDATSSVLARGSFTININDFSIVTSSLPPICSGTAYSAIIDICGGQPPFTWETIDWDPSVLPLNFTVPGPANSRQNTLTGTPVTPGAYTLKIRVTDSRGDTFRIEKEFTLEVTDEITILTPQHLPPGVVSILYNHSLKACGGVTPYTWDKIDTTTTPWPVFLSLDPSGGTLSGTPTVAGAYVLKVKLSESGGSSTVEFFSLTVAASLLTITNMNVTCIECIGCTYNLSGMLSGGLGVPYWQLAAGEILPPGFNLSTGGVLSGMATTPGTFNFKVNVNDGTTDPLNPPQGTVTVTVSLNPADSGVAIERARQWPVDPNYQPPDRINLAENRKVKFDFQITNANWESTWNALVPTPMDPVEKRQVTLTVVGLCNVNISSIEIRKSDTDGDGVDEHVAVFALSDSLVQDFVQLVTAAGGVNSSPFTFRIKLNVPESMSTLAVSRIENIIVVNEP